MSSSHGPSRISAGRRTVTRSALALLLVVVPMTPANAAVPGVQVITSGATMSDGGRQTVTNHLTAAARGPWKVPREYLLVWAGAEQNGPKPPDPDFMAVVDATRGTPEYGKVVNTVTIDGVYNNEPHHVQYVWHKGDKVYAAGIISDRIYALDVSKLPLVTLSGVTASTDTPCGSAPDAFQVLSDGTAYGTMMGGPDVSGSCTYTNGQTRTGNGFAGSPGEIVRLAPNGRVLSESPAAATVNEGVTCDNVPSLPVPTCANPHGIAVREDLGRMVTSDYAEIRDLLGDKHPVDVKVTRDTVRIFDISRRDAPKLLSFQHLPPGPRPAPYWWTRENYASMEAAMPVRREHRGAFAETSNGAVYYTPDVTRPHPAWREIFDDATAFTSLFPTETPTSVADGGSWLQTSPDDHYLYHVVIGAGWNSPAAHSHGGMLYTLDIRKLLAAGTRTRCSVDTIPETLSGGDEPDCPKLVSAISIPDQTTGGPHWAAMDHFRRTGDHYREAAEPDRIAVSDYFVAGLGVDGNHRVCMFNTDGNGKLTLDTAWRDENTGKPCLEFNRTLWPHGNVGGARPHGVLFVIPNASLR